MKEEALLQRQLSVDEYSTFDEKLVHFKVEENKMRMADYQTKIKVTNFNFYYGQDAALKKVNMDIYKKKITAVIGPSGCGKSTFIRCFNRMNDMIPNIRYEGQIMVDGLDVLCKEMDVVDLRKKIGMVFQKPNPFPMSIFNNVAYGLRVNGIKNKDLVEMKVEKSLKDAALWDEVKDRLRKSAMSLSGGQQQRLCIARALAIDPEILLFDEPTSALDPITTAKFEALTKELKKNYTIIIVTHNMQQAARISDMTSFFMLGKLIEYNTTDGIFKNPRQVITEYYVRGRIG